MQAYRYQTECELTHILSQIVCTIMQLLPVDKLNWLDLYDVPHARNLLHSLDFWEHTIREAMVNKLASLTATTSVVDTSARIVQILLDKVGALEPIFHAVRIWVPRSLLIYLRRRLPDLPLTKRSSAIGALVLPWNMEVGSPRNIDIRMPNLLCSQLQPRFLRIIKQRFLRITSNDQYEKLFPRKTEQLHFQVAFYHLDNPTAQQPYFGGLHAFLRNNFPIHPPNDYVAPLRILASNTTAARSYSLMLDELLQTAPPHRTELENFTEEFGVLFFQPYAVEFARVLKAAKTRTRALSVSDQRSGRRPVWSNKSSWQSSSSWHSTSWHNH